MVFGIVANGSRDKDFAFSRKAAAEIKAKGSSTVVDGSFANTALGTDLNVEVADYSHCDLIFCIGGDGTLLAAVHDHYTKGIPFIGVNLGSIGFLTEIQPEDFSEALDKILAGKFTITNRMQLDVAVFDKDGRKKSSGVCMNDVVIARGQLLRIFSMDFFVDGDYAECISGDGVIISTPIGSTAYSLAAGGPILKPELDVFLVTPICPHTLHNRSYVVSQESSVEVRLSTFTEPPMLSLDGRNGVALDPFDRITVKKSDAPMLLAQLGYGSFYQSVRKKIHARGSFYEDEQK